MTGRKGPVFIDIPRDVLNNHVLQTEIAPPEHYRPDYPPLPHPDAIREAVHLLQQAERPLMLVGGGVTWAQANAQVVRLSEQYALPMITAYGRNDAVPNAHANYIGPLGAGGSPEAAAACRRVICSWCLVRAWGILRPTMISAISSLEHVLCRSTSIAVTLAAPTQ